jgi:hypothetical protein
MNKCLLLLLLEEVSAQNGSWKDPSGGGGDKVWGNFWDLY